MAKKHRAAKPEAPTTNDSTRHPVEVLADLAASARSPQTALFPGNGDRVGYWLTPPEIFEPLQSEFKFDFDACPYPRPPGFDGLKADWGGAAWVNPPFEGPRTGFAGWARKGLAEHAKGKTVVFILPVDNWMRLLIEGGAEVRSLGNHDWIHGVTGKRRKAPRPSLLFILRKR